MDINQNKRDSLKPKKRESQGVSKLRVCETFKSVISVPIKLLTILAHGHRLKDVIHCVLFHV